MKYLAAFLAWSCCRRCGFVARQKISPNLLNFGLKCSALSNYENEYPHFMTEFLFLKLPNRALFSPLLHNVPFIKNVVAHADG